jgi:hypothetical protein
MIARLQRIALRAAAAAVLGLAWASVAGACDSRATATSPCCGAEASPRHVVDVQGVAALPAPSGEALASAVAPGAPADRDESPCCPGGCRHCSLPCCGGLAWATLVAPPVATAPLDLPADMVPLAPPALVSRLADPDLERPPRR